MKKIIVLILSILIAVQVSAQSSLLQKKVSLHYKEISIADALKVLRLKYGIQFSYSSNIVPANKKVQLYLKQVTLDVALKTIFLDTEIGYEVVGTQIVLRRVAMPKPQGRLSTRSKPMATIKIPEPEIKKVETVVVLPPDSTKADTVLQQVSLPQPELVLEASAKDSSISEEKLDSAFQEQRSKMRIKMAAMRDSLKSKGKWTVHQLNLLFSDIEEEFRQDYLHKRDSIRYKDKEFLPRPRWNGFSSQQQDSLNPDYIHNKVQVSLVYPIGSNGIEAPYYINNFSLNVLAGYNGGVQGAELSGFANIIRQDVKGFQAAGFVNAVVGNVEGFQGAGFVNAVNKDVSGLQGAGFINVVGKRVSGFQAAGFMNVVGQSSNGIQGAGFMNINGTHSKGLQAAGFMNLVGENAIGTQGAGFINVAGKKVTGLQAAGFANLCGESLKGFQGAGFLNITAKNVEGAQVAGFMNICGGTMTGVQGSGFMNIARRLRGTQIGVFNFADTLEKGVPIGFFSFVRKGGKHNLEVFGSETFQANMAFKTGVKRFYNILYVGYQTTPDYYRWAFGYGAGTEFSLGKKMYMDVDFISMHINEDEPFTEKTNIVNRLQLSVGYQLSKGIAVFVGPNFNYMISEFQNEDGTYGSKIPRWKIAKVGNYGDQMFWGVTAGLRFF